MRWAVVLAGGVGSRFWPLSSAARPKQLLPLAGEHSLLAESVQRLLGPVTAERVLVVTSRALAAAVRAEVAPVPEANVLVEPVARSTAPALAFATAHAARQDPDATVLSVHADWAVGDVEAFQWAAGQAMALAEQHDVLVTVGARPTRAETGYGHIVPGQPLDGGGARRITRFVEKPDLALAESLMFLGALWNTGMFAWSARRFRSEVAAHTPELSRALPHLDAGDVNAFFAACTPVTIDVGLWERTARGAVVAGDFGWDDVGSWAALRRARATDEAGNVIVGRAFARECANTVVWADEGAVVVDGLRDAVVVRARGITLVTTAERAPDLKKLLDALPADLTGDRGA